MQAKCAIYYLCVVMVCITSSDSSNIDTFEPIMRHSPELNAASETHFPDDLFGYTLVLHQLDEAGGINSTRLVSDN